MITLHSWLGEGEEVLGPVLHLFDVALLICSLAVSVGLNGLWGLLCFLLVFRTLLCVGGASSMTFPSW